MKKKNPERENTGKGSGLSLLAAVPALLLAFVCLFLIHSLRAQLSEQKEMHGALAETVDRHGQELITVHDSVSLENEKGEVYTLSASVDELDSELTRQQTVLDDHQQQLDTLTEDVGELREKVFPAEREGYIFYTVEPGETLGSICKQLNIDYWANEKLILNLNEITNSNLVFPKQELKFPESIVEE